ncbi:META domain-containing protein [Xanthobacter sp. TB0139]|uniref:META domain-containing protein n=1 Tax=Xanthobacter sp. TB0139 TaxID=3459178 RepID=UPI004039023D
MTRQTHQPGTSQPLPHARRRLLPLLAASALLALGSLGPAATPSLADEPPPANDPLNREASMPQSPAPASPIGQWLLEDMQGAGSQERVRTDLEISADGRAFGSGGCNRFNGEAKLSDNQLSFGPLMSTRMACSEEAMKQEARFLNTLEDVRSWKLDDENQKLLLLGPEGETLLTFSAL